MGVPGREARSLGNTPPDALIGEALIWLMSEVEQPHWLQQDSQITEGDCRAERGLQPGHIPPPTWLPSWGA